MLEGFDGCQALLLVHFEEFRDQVLCLRRNLLPSVSFHLPRAFLHSFENDVLRGAVEGRLATEHDEQDDADAPDVTLFVVVAA